MGLLVNYLSHICRAVLFIILSLALHSLLLTFNFSSQPGLQRVKRVGVGLVRRPVSQFSQVVQGSVPTEPLLDSQLRPAHIEKMGIVPVDDSQSSSTEQKSTKEQLKNSAVSQEKVTPKQLEKGVVKDEPVNPVKEAAALPVEVEAALDDSQQSQKEIAKMNVPTAGFGAGKVSEVEEFAAQREGGIESTDNFLSVGVGFQDALPRYDLNPRPKYPEVAQRRGFEGTVLLEVLVRVDGRVEKISFKESSGYRSLDRSALSTVRRWRFSPATAMGVAVESSVVVPIGFTLHAK